jgi:hypothetical protein
MKMRQWLLIVLALCALAAIGFMLVSRACRARIVLSLPLCPALAPVPVVVPAPVPVPPPEPVRPSRVGEKIKYTVKLGMLKLGESVFTQVQSETVGGIKADVFLFETKLFRFSDTEKIFGNPENFLPLRVERDISAWPKKENITEEYDQKADTVTLVKNGKRDEIKSSGPLQNAILLPFSLREYKKIGPGWSMKVNLPTQKFEILFDGEEKVRVPAGEFTTYHFRSEPDKFEVWVTADESRIPVKIRGTGALGYILFMSGYTPPDSVQKDAAQL